ncbi:MULTISPECIES: hypothetical protein [Chromobacterium]|uniref:hypothetical protein n=1 Tax=Chromobacterium TaxID=535 RepID=UPI0018ED145C|nr:hypothetical protein [Chromobacterium sp. ASV23]
MAKSSAERQATFRERCVGDRKRLSMLVAVDAKRTLEQLAVRWNVSQRKAFERLMGEVELRELLLPDAGTLTACAEVNTVKAGEGQKKETVAAASAGGDTLRNLAEIMAEHWNSRHW